MSDLQVCQGCRRHIRVTESDCPFCAEPNRNPLTPGRKALLAGALVGAATLGCESKPKSVAPPPEEPAVVIDAAAPVVAMDAAPAAAPADASMPDAGAPDAAPAKKKRKKKKEPKEATKAEPVERVLPPMPYGAPPARKRFV